MTHTLSQHSTLSTLNSQLSHKLNSTQLSQTQQLFNKNTYIQNHNNN